MSAAEALGPSSPSSPASPLIALVGNPNCGKTALFNRLTGARQKVANYAGVTVERKMGRFQSADGRQWQVLDLPGAYSLSAVTPDEVITRDVVTGQRAGEALPDGIVCVVDATNLPRGLRIVLELQQLGLPMVLALNMMDVAKSRHIRIDTAALEAALGIPVVETVAVRPGGEQALVATLARLRLASLADGERRARPFAAEPVEALQARVQAILAHAVVWGDVEQHRFTERIDRFVLHPVLGPALLAAILFLVFQAVFAWAQWPMDQIKAGVEAVSGLVNGLLPEGPLRGLLVDGILSGTGNVLVFLPQILILFFFILALEDSGYLPRAAFLLDRLMGSVGLSGRAFIPLLSSFACAIPGVMATRTIQNPRDRLVTIMLAPLMTCSARLPVYALIIAAFIPQRQVLGVMNLQGLVLFSLYVAGIVSALGVALVLKRRDGARQQPLMLELPDYRWPHAQNLLLGLWERARIFLRRVGTIILSLMILIWFLSSFPAPPAGATQPAIYYSIAGLLGRGLEWIFAPIGFNWQICIALVPGLAAREVAVGALGTVYSLSQAGDALQESLAPVIGASWGLPTALSLLAWYVFAPQCVATLSVVKRETNSWRYVAIMAGYLFGLAYIASFVTFHVARWAQGLA